MGRIKENLNGGVMTGPDPAVLPPGTLSSMRNAVYRPNSQALQRADGRSAFGTVTASAGDVNGLRDIQFDNGDHYLVAQASCTGAANWSTALVEGAGTFGVLTATVTATNSLEAVHYANRFYMMNGAISTGTFVNTNAVLYLSSTATNSQLLVRQHGMFPVSSTGPSGTAAANFAGSASGFYEYWTTEVFKYTQDGIQDELESTFAGTPLTVYVSATSVAPVVQMPTPANGIATHWRIYRSPVKVFSTDRAYPDGFRVAEQTTASAQYTDTSTTTVGSQVLGGGVQGSPYGGFTNAARLTAADGSYASGAVAAFVGQGWPPYNPVRQAVSAFNFGGFQGPVLGIAAEVKAYISSGTVPAAGWPFTVTLCKQNANTGYQSAPYGSRSANITASSPSQTVTLGGTTDRWVAPESPPFVDTDFDTNFMAIIEFGVAGKTIGVDYIKLNVYYGAGQSEAAIIPFPTVVYTFGDVVAQVGKHGPPPSSNTGDMFQEQLVVNDVGGGQNLATPPPGATAPLGPKSLIRYSFPGLPESFPATYYLDFQTKDNDQVTCIKAVNNRLVVGLANSVWRVNYLPSERDSSFDRGLAIEPVSRNFGIANAMCACVFSIDDDQEVLAFVSQKGIHLTNGYHVSTQTQNQNWRAILSTAAGVTSTPIALINDPENQDLLFYYRNDDLTPETFMCLHLNYSLTHMGTLHSDTGPSRTFEAGLKISGPVHLRNYHAGSTSYAGIKSAWSVPRLNGDTSIFLGYGAASGAGATAAGAGVVYRETGSNIPANDPAFRYVTRRMYLAGESGEARLNELYGYVGSNATAGGAPALVYTALTTKTNDDSGEVTQSAATASLGGRKLHKVQFQNICEGLRVSAAITANQQNDVAQEYILLDGENFGPEDSGL